MSYEVLYNFMLNSKTSKIDNILSTVLYLNPNETYYLQIFNVSYSNVWANIKENLIISPSNSWIIDGTPVSEVIIPAGSLLSLNAIYTAIQEATNNLMMLNINAAGLCEISFDSTVSTVSISSGDLGILNSMFCGYFDSSISSPILTTSPKMPSVSDFNKVLINCNLINSNTFLDRLQTNNLLCLSAQGEPYEYIDYVAKLPLLFPIKLDQIKQITFNLTDENGNELKQVSNTNSDLFIWCAISKPNKQDFN